MLSSGEEILFNFLIPSELIPARDVGSQFRQLFWRQFVKSLLDFRETHEQT